MNMAERGVRRSKSSEGGVRDLRNSSRSPIEKSEISNQLGLNLEEYDNSCLNESILIKPSRSSQRLSTDASDRSDTSQHKEGKCKRDVRRAADGKATASSRAAAESVRSQRKERGLDGSSYVGSRRISRSPKRCSSGVSPKSSSSERFPSTKRSGSSRSPKRSSSGILRKSSSSGRLAEGGVTNSRGRVSPPERGVNMTKSSEAYSRKTELSRSQCMGGTTSGLDDSGHMQPQKPKRSVKESKGAEAHRNIKDEQSRSGSIKLSSEAQRENVHTKPRRAGRRKSNDSSTCGTESSDHALLKMDETPKRGVPRTRSAEADVRRASEKLAATPSRGVDRAKSSEGLGLARRRRKSIDASASSLSRSDHPPRSQEVKPLESASNKSRRLVRSNSYLGPELLGKGLRRANSAIDLGNFAGAGESERINPKNRTPRRSKSMDMRPNHQNNDVSGLCENAITKPRRAGRRKSCDGAELPGRGLQRAKSAVDLPSFKCDPDRTLPFPRRRSNSGDDVTRKAESTSQGKGFENTETKPRRAGRRKSCGGDEIPARGVQRAKSALDLRNFAEVDPVTQFQQRRSNSGGSHFTKKSELDGGSSDEKVAKPRRAGRKKFFDGADCAETSVENPESQKHSPERPLSKNSKEILLSDMDFETEGHKRLDEEAESHRTSQCMKAEKHGDPESRCVDEYTEDCKVSHAEEPKRDLEHAVTDNGNGSVPSKLDSESDGGKEDQMKAADEIEDSADAPLDEGNDEQDLKCAGEATSQDASMQPATREMSEMEAFFSQMSSMAGNKPQAEDEDGLQSVAGTIAAEPLKQPEEEKGGGIEDFFASMSTKLEGGNDTKPDFAKQRVKRVHLDCPEEEVEIAMAVSQALALQSIKGQGGGEFSKNMRNIFKNQGGKKKSEKKIKIHQKLFGTKSEATLHSHFGSTNIKKFNGHGDEVSLGTTNDKKSNYQQYLVAEETSGYLPGALREPCMVSRSA